MIAEIGIMMGLYIITRCASFLGRTEPSAVKVLSVITIIATSFFVCALVIQGLIGSSHIR